LSPPADATPLVRIERVTKRFGAVAALDDLSLDIRRGEFFALLGPSGCGKTTLMRLIAGFETAEKGRVLLDGADLASTPPHRRPVNMMFQSYALFPHMSVEKNIAFGLEREGLKRADVEARVSEMLRLVQLEPLRRRKPDQLSGGQKQRVALARALAKRPRLLLLDEPLAALDRKLREETQFELMHVQRSLGTTFMLVTHDQDEAMVVADRIAVMREGKIEQLGSGRDLYSRPATRWVAGFIGEINLFEAIVMADVAAGAECEARLTSDDATYRVNTQVALRKDQRVMLAVRPESLALWRTERGQLSGEIVDVVFRGDMTIARVRLPSGFVARAAWSNASGDGDAPLTRGERVYLSFQPNAATVLAS
jgi:putrescine transport system ATP-binding protein